MSFRNIQLLTCVVLTGLFLSLQFAPSATAQGSGAFELGGQTLTFLNPDEMRAAGMTWLKMQVTYRRGGPNGDAQNVITHARNHGFKVLLSIKGEKSEFAGERHNPEHIEARNIYYQDYANYVASVAGSVTPPDAIEIWNEPNIEAEWPVGLIDGEEYTNMLRRAYPAIKAANPDVMVISGAPAPTGFFGGADCIDNDNGCDDNIFIQEMAAAGAADHFDCTGIHYNEGVLPPSASSGDPRGNPNHHTRYYPTMVNLYRSVFPTKPLCFTEIGYISPDGLGGLPAGLEWGLNTSAQEQAQWLAQAAQISRDSGIVRLMIVWNVNATFKPDNVFAGWAIIRANNQCLACDTLANVMGIRAPRRNVYTTNRVTLAWGGVTWAQSYQLQISQQRNMGKPLVHEATVDGSTLQLRTPALSTGQYFWRVRAQQSDSSWGDWSTVDEFYIDAP